MESVNVSARGIVPLRGSVQNYLWGRPGKTGLVARVASGSNLPVKEDEHYAEIWFGTHSKGPSYAQLREGERSLLDYLGAPLPYLLKILSVNSVLSIQAHPDKAMAAKLHDQDSKTYSDSNHKPEMVIALTEFEALCGFRPLEEIVHFVRHIAELRRVIGEEQSEQFIARSAEVGEGCTAEECVKQAFAAVMKKNNPRDLETIIKDNVVSLTTSTSYHNSDDLVQTAVTLAGRLAKDFPKDAGVFCVFFLNYLILPPGEALFIPPRIPHAYLHGEALECMACSDNVVRAGLTPKEIHVNTLCDMLSYTPGNPERPVLVRGGPSSVTYCPREDFQEFQVARIHVPAGEAVEVRGVHGPSIMLVLSGQGTAHRLLPRGSRKRTHQESEARGSTSSTTSEDGRKFSNGSDYPSSLLEQEDVDDPCLTLELGSAFLVPCSAQVLLAATNEDLVVFQAATNQACSS